MNSMRPTIIAGNWKMNLDLEASQQLASEIVQMVADEVRSDRRIVIAPPFVQLTTVGRLLDERVALGAQNCYPEPKGAFTGEVSAPMLRAAGVRYVILGHSERREYFGENAEFLARKVDSALAEELTPIFCCGEPLAVREAGEHVGYVRQQLTDSLFHLPGEEVKRLVLAYEPIWAIGTGQTATAEQAQQMHADLRAHLAERYGDDVAQRVPILYGGSMKPNNAAELLAQPDVDGGLIGGASLTSRDFVDIIKS